MLSIPPELRKITPYIRRAEELDKDQSSPESRLVAYYSRQYAVHTGIPLASSSPEAKTCLGQLLQDLEKEKAAMDNFTRQEAAFLCRAFSNKVFDKADGEDRIGLANKTTAKTFYAAASFFQILEQFYDDSDAQDAPEEDKKRIIYAKWKAMEILKAVKEGRTPTPGGYGEEEEEEQEEAVEVDAKGETEEEESRGGAPMVETVSEEESDGQEDSADPPEEEAPPVMPAESPVPSDDEAEEEDSGTEVALGLGPPPPAFPTDDSFDPAPPAFDPPKVADRPPMSYNLPPPMAAPLPAPPAAPPKKTGMFGFGKKKTESISRAQLADATELARFALAALEDRDGELGAERLQQALAALGR